MKNRLEIFKSGVAISTISMLILLGTLLLVMASGGLQTRFLYALSIDTTDQRFQWIESEELSVFKEAYFAPVDESMWEEYRVLESEDYYVLGSFDKTQLFEQVEEPVTDELQEEPEEELQAPVEEGTEEEVLEEGDGEAVQDEEISGEEVTSDIADEREETVREEPAEEVTDSGNEAVGEDGTLEESEEGTPVLPEESVEQEEEIPVESTDLDSSEAPVEEENQPSPEEEEVTTEDGDSEVSESDLQEEGVDVVAPEEEELGFFGGLSRMIVAMISGFDWGTAQVVEESTVEEAPVDEEVLADEEVVEEPMVEEPAGEDVPAEETLVEGEEESVEQEGEDVPEASEEAPDEQESVESSEQEVTEDEGTPEEGVEDTEAEESVKEDVPAEETLIEGEEEPVEQEGEDVPEVSEEAPDEQESVESSAQEVTEDEGTPEEVIIEESEPEMTFEDFLRQQPEKIEKEELLSNPAQLLNEDDDVLVLLGKDGSLTVYMPGLVEERSFRILPEENVLPLVSGGMVHYLHMDEGYVTSYFYDADERSLKEWVVMFDAPEGGVFQYQRFVELPEQYRWTRSAQEVWHVRSAVEGLALEPLSAPTRDLFELKADYVVGQNYSIPDQMLRTYYSNGALTSLYVDREGLAYPMVLERNWEMAEQSDVSSLRPDDLRAAAAQNQLRRLEAMPMNFSVHAEADAVSYSARKSMSRYFFRDREFTGTWFVPYQNYQAYREELSLQEESASSEEETAVEEEIVAEEALDIDQEGLVEPSDEDALSGEVLEEETQLAHEEISCPADQSFLSRVLPAPSAEPFVFAQLRQQFVGASVSASLMPGELARQVSHEYRGNDPQSWEFGKETSSELIAEQLYPGVDWKLGSDASGLTQSFELSRAELVDRIKMRFPTTEDFEILVSGDLSLDLGACRLVLSRPYARYLDEDQLPLIPLQYVALRDRVLGMELLDEGLADAEIEVFVRTLPALSTCLYAPQYEEDQVVLEDEQFAYVVGNTAPNVSFPVVTDEYQCQTREDFDPVIRKISYEDQETVFQTVFGGADVDLVSSLTLHALASEDLENADLERYVDPDAVLEDSVDDESALNVLLEDGQKALFLQGTTASYDFPGLDILTTVSEEDFRALDFDIEIFQDGWLFVDGVNLAELSVPQELVEEIDVLAEDSSQEQDSTRRSDTEEAEESENIDAEEEQAQESAEGEESLSDEQEGEPSDEEGELRGAAPQEGVDSQEVVESVEIPEDSELLEDAGESQRQELEGAVSDGPEPLFAFDIDEQLLAQIQRVFVNPDPERYSLEFAASDESETSIVVYFRDRASGLVTASLTIDLYELLELESARE